MNRNFSFIITFILILLTFNSFSQKRSKIEVRGANSMESNRKIGGGVTRLIGNVILKQDDVWIYCDSAYRKKNSFQAFSNVHVKRGKTLNIYSDFLDHNGNKKLAKFRENVKMIDGDMILNTQFLDYYLDDNSGHFFNGGKIVDSATVLTSKSGRYFPDKDLFFFKDSVVVIDPDYTIYTDTLKYDKLNDISYFFGPTEIISDSNYLYCENGWYNMQSDIAQFNKNAYYQNDKQTLKGDSLYYDRTLGIGKGFINVELKDTVENIILQGDKVFYQEEPEYAIVTEKALFIHIADNDSLFLHADTLNSIYDSTGTFRILKAYHKSTIYRSDFQGMCDSLVYSFQDSIIRMFDNPILWFGVNQITAQQINAFVIDDNLDHFELNKSSLIISPKDSIRYDQVKGQDMKGYIKNDELARIDIFKKGETMYFPIDQDGFIGSNHVTSNNYVIHLKNNEVQNIVFKETPKAVLSPFGFLPLKELYLRGFIWLDDYRPQKKQDVFKWKEINLY
ncbi:MAG: organic solvent tolerance protein OstA [Chlorobi bacterium]|nr:organic solvent tolerance protein OstA [Chlorobiota bacterium]